MAQHALVRLQRELSDSEYERRKRELELSGEQQRQTLEKGAFEEDVNERKRRLAREREQERNRGIWEHELQRRRTAG